VSSLFFIINLNFFSIAHKYHSRAEFMRDIQQIVDNCVLYNGDKSPLTVKAEVLLKVSKDTLSEV
jgi:transcription initiation factor TFIID subunit 1